MHPPDFHPDQRLSDWPHCCVEINCACTGRCSIPPIRMIMKNYGDLTFRELLAKLRCEKCGQRPAPVYLVAGHHRKYAFGPPTCW